MGSWVDKQLEKMSDEKVLSNPAFNGSLFTEHDIYLFKQGNHFQLYDKFGAHQVVCDGLQGTYFAVCAPNAESVSVIGEFNGWNNEAHKLNAREDSSGIWEGFIGGVQKGTLYKYFVKSRHNGYSAARTDPYAFYNELRPNTASIVWDLDYKWNDRQWMKTRKKRNSHDAPFSIYELHFSSWRRIIEEDNRSLTYREMAHQLADYCVDMGFTHVEFLPLMEFPFDGSWGYQSLGYFSPTSRFGTPQDFKYLVDHLHQNGIGILLDWVPSHFPSDEHGLVYFDGTHLFEHADPKKGFHPDWKSYIFNHGRTEIKEFLISSALFWLKEYHVDGLRVDAVASMLYLDYSRQEGEWIPNQYGGNENIEAIEFLKCLNMQVYENFPDVQMIAEESTAWGGVSRPVHAGGLGFGMKWNMGWMNDTLEYFSKNPIHRKYHHHELTFSFLYTFSENFVISLSHDEVVHGKGSLLGRMPNDEWQRFANLRLLYAYMFAHPGKKLLFMGCEFGQVCEWNYQESLEWHVLQYDCHKGVQSLLRDLNHFYRDEKCLHRHDFYHEGFEWIAGNDVDNGVVAFIRREKGTNNQIVVVCNFTPTTHQSYLVGVPQAGAWTEVFNSDDPKYWGSGQKNPDIIETKQKECHGRKDSLSLTLPPLGVVYLKKSKGSSVEVINKKEEIKKFQ